MLAITLCIFGVLCLIQKIPARRFVACVIVITELAHYFLFNDSDGLLYYGSAALFDLLAIILISTLAIPSALAKQILFIYAASIAVNYVGFVLWLTYMEPTLYNWGFVILNLCTIICLIKREPGHGGRSTDNSSGSFVYRHNYFSR